MKKNKYTGLTKLQKSIRCRCDLGHIHDSIGERRWCNILKIKKRDGKIKEFNIQIPYPIFLNGKLICKHIVDFCVLETIDKLVIHEFKGMQLPIWKLKYKLFKACYPRIEYKVITAKDVNDYLSGIMQ